MRFRGLGIGVFPNGPPSLDSCYRYSITYAKTAILTIKAPKLPLRIPKLVRVYVWPLHASELSWSLTQLYRQQKSLAKEFKLSYHYKELCTMDLYYGNSNQIKLLKHNKNP